MLLLAAFVCVGGVFLTSGASKRASKPPSYGGFAGLFL